MSASEAYKAGGADLLRGLLPAEVASVMTQIVGHHVAQDSANCLVQPTSILDRTCYEATSRAWPMLDTFLWGMTPKIEEVAGVRLLPTYCYFRAYQQGDVCRVHSDRPACEHSLSLTLAYANGIPWALAMADTPINDAKYPQTLRGDDDFADEAHSEYLMAPGDAVIYRGTSYRHGRVKPNPNRWSAHLFMHWVERDGEHRNQKFDGRSISGTADFKFSDQKITRQ